MRLVQNKSQRRNRVSLHCVIPSLQLWKLRLIVKLEKAVPEKKLSLSKGQGSGDKRLALWACSFVLEILVIILTFMSLEWIYVLRPWGNSDKWRRTKYDKAAFKFLRSGCFRFTSTWEMFMFVKRWRIYLSMILLQRIWLQHTSNCFRIHIL